jgi:hypothetical protein
LEVVALILQEASIIVSIGQAMEEETQTQDQREGQELAERDKPKTPPAYWTHSREKLSLNNNKWMKFEEIRSLKPRKRPPQGRKMVIFPKMPTSKKCLARTSTSS